MYFLYVFFLFYSIHLLSFHNFYLIDGETSLLARLSVGWMVGRSVGWFVCLYVIIYQKGFMLLSFTHFIFISTSFIERSEGPSDEPVIKLGLRVERERSQRKGHS